MPTRGPWLTVTETEVVARAIDIAARRWPGKTRAQLLVLLVEEGVQRVQDDEVQRRELITATSGALTGAYGTDHLAALREDWSA